MRHVFVSYCHDDADFAQILKEQLVQAGFPVWKDLDLQAGDNWRSEIEEAIRGALAVALVLSERAAASAYVSFEWAFALGAGIPVLPLLLKIQPNSLHPRLTTLQALDFSNYMLRPWDALARSLKALSQAERPLSVAVPRDAPMFVQQAVRSLDSSDASERAAAMKLLTELTDPGTREVLAEALRHPLADVRESAAQALAELKDLRAIPVVLEAIRYERFDRVNYDTLAQFGEQAIPILTPILRDATQGVGVRKAIAYVFGKMLDANTAEALHELLRSPEPELRATALQSLAGYTDALPWFLEYLEADDQETLWVTLEGLQKYDGPDVVAAFVKALGHPKLSVRQSAATALVEKADSTAVPALLKALRDDDNVVRNYAQKALSKVADASLIPALFDLLTPEYPYKRNVAELLTGLKGEAVLNGMLSLLKSENIKLRINAADSLGKLRDSAAVPDLIRALDDPEEDVRQYAAFALGALKDARAVPPLIAIAKRDDEFDDVQRAAALALNDIGTREARIAYRDWSRKNEQQGRA